MEGQSTMNSMDSRQELREGGSSQNSIVLNVTKCNVRSLCHNVSQLICMCVYIV